jgi:very-short-patch-repair endonuclease
VNCKECGSSLDVSGNKKFCNRSCAISHSNKNRKLTPESKFLMGASHRNKSLSESHKRKISESVKRNPTPQNLPSMKGRKFSEERNNKLSKTMRILRINQVIENCGHAPVNMGKNEKLLLDKQEILDNCKIERGYHIKDLGYIVDGYCLETNTVYEVYEKYHLTKSVNQRDIKRQNEIQESLGCKFIIIEDF